MNSRGHILLISYHWPPTGGVAVQRWLKLVKYLSREGWRVTVYTAENPLRGVEDRGLELEVPEDVRVVRHRVLEPERAFNRLVGRRGGVGLGFLNEEGGKSKGGVVGRLGLWARANVFIPDARCVWIKPSIRFLKAFLRDNPVDVVISTGPPHSMHLIGYSVARKAGVPFVSDFRDPWSDLDYMLRLPLSVRSRRRHERLEARVVGGADGVVVMTEALAEDFRKHGPRRLIVVPNGYDPEDFVGHVGRIADSGPLRLLHAGSLTPDRNPLVLWRVLRRLKDEGLADGSRLRVESLGAADASVRGSVEEIGIGDMVDFLPFEPHGRVVNRMSGASVLLLCMNATPSGRVIHTLKVFEYLAARRPIVCLGPEDGPAGRLIAECGAGVTYSLDDEGGLYEYLRGLLRGGVPLEPVGDGDRISVYARDVQAGAYGRFLDEVIGEYRLRNEERG